MSRNGLPALPKPGQAVKAEKVQQIEADAIRAVAFLDDIAVGLEWNARAAAVEAYLRSPELQRPILGARRRIEARIGQLLGPAENRGPATYPHEDRLVDLIPRSEDRVNFRLLARMLGGDCTIGDDEWRKSRRALVALARFRLGMMPETPDLPLGKFCCIVADPPWQQHTGPDVFNGTGERGHDALTYAQMSLEEITGLKDRSGRSIEECAADDAHLYLWTINKYVEQSYAVARAWGFKPSVLLTWEKSQHGVGLGDTYRLTSEFILFARRGSLPHRQIIPMTVFHWPRGSHSQKPAEFYDMVESVTPATEATRLDLFARTARANWTVWGNEV